MKTPDPVQQLGSARLLCSLVLFLALGISVAFAQQRDLNTGWTAYEKGFNSRPGEGKAGQAAIYCESSNGEESHGALNTVSLNQKQAAPFVVSAWSRSEDISGTPDDGYSLYLDINYMDGAHLWGTISPFLCGTHGWQKRQIHMTPAKPVKDVLVYVLLRSHTGKAWFSDVSISALDGRSTFDFQTIRPPKDTSGHWFVRDVAANSPVTPVGQAAKLSLGVEGEKTQRLKVRDLSGQDRALTLYYCERVNVSGGRWWNSIRNATPISDSEYGTLTSSASGANGLASLYPFAAITTQSSGRMLAVPPSMGPRVVRFFYNAPSELFCVAFDVALTKANKANPSDADAEVRSLPIDP